jgi:hypothetical protein
MKPDCGLLTQMYEGEEVGARDMRLMSRFMPTLSSSGVCFVHPVFILVTKRRSGHFAIYESLAPLTDQLSRVLVGRRSPCPTRGEQYLLEP